MTRDELVDELIGCAKEIWTKYWGALPDEQRLRLAGMEEELRGITRGVEEGLWALVGEELDKLAIELEGQCPCGRRRERRKGSVELDLLGHRIEFACTYLYCRSCHKGVNCFLAPHLAGKQAETSHTV